MIRSLAFIQALLLGMGSAAENVKRPNVVLIVCDDLNDYLTGIPGGAGHPQARTPHMGKLARDGVSFRRAYSNNPVCAPSRSSFLTGIYPHTSGNLFWNKWFTNPVLANSRTLMEHFRANGYRVIGSGKMMHHERRSDWDEFPHAADYGPIAYDGKTRVGHPSVPEPFRSIGPIDGSFGPLSDVPFGGRNGAGWIYGKWGETRHMSYRSDQDRDPTPDEIVARWAAQRIRAFASNAEVDPEAPPFFMGVGFIRPHTPMYAPRKYFEMFPLETLKLPVIKTGDSADTHYRSVFDEDVKGLRYYRRLGESYPTIDDGLKAFVQAYLACVAAVDDCIGTVVDAVEQSGLAGHTILIVTSDHGWNNGQKDYLFKNSPWEESTRVPLFIRAPGVTTGQRVAGHPVSLIDLYPTLIDLCGLPRDTMKNEKGRPLDGHSLRPFLENPGATDWDGPPAALTMIFAGEKSIGTTGKHDASDPACQHWSLRTERWRYIRYNNGSEELYDHDQDPHEWANLADRPESRVILGKLRGQLAAQTGIRRIAQ